MPRRTERQTLREMHDGRREACAELVRRHYRAVYRFLAYLSGDTSLAEDLTQETFASAWANLGQLKRRASVRTWLHRIAHRKFIDATRRQRRGAAAAGVLGREHRGRREGSSPLHRLMADEGSRRLYEAVGTLEPHERLVIVLHYVQDMSFREMAKVLDEPVGTIKCRNSQALRRLRALLNGEV